MEQALQTLIVCGSVAMVPILQALQTLIVCGFVAMVPVFQFSSVYVVTGTVARLLEDPALERECCDFVSTDKQLGKTQLKIDTIFRLYCEFVPHVP